MSAVPITRANAATSPFAHLASGAPKAAEDDKDPKAKAKDDEDDQTDADDDSGDDKDDKDKKSKKSKKAKAEDDESDAKAADDDDGDKKDNDDKDARAARARERSRISAIVLSEPGKANPVGAMHLAVGTSMSRGEAINLLSAMQSGAPPAVAAAPAPRDQLRTRMTTEPSPAVGSEEQGAGPTLAQQIVLAGRKASGEA